MTFGSLFSGIGGLDLGLERAGMTCKWQSEIDPYASQVLKKHWPEVPNYGDITKIDWSGVDRVDLICGGFPCQPHSLAGKREGADDERNLWPEVVHCLRETEARWFLGENVAGLLSSDDGRMFATILGDLAALGYDATWGSLRASDFGAPHRRERVFLLAYRSGERCRETGELRPDTITGIGSKCAELANAMCERREESWSDPEWQEGTKIVGRSAELGDANTGGRGIERGPAVGNATEPGLPITRPTRERELPAEGESGLYHRSEFTGGGLDHTEGTSTGGLPIGAYEEYSIARVSSRALPPFPPRPNDAQAWADVINRWPGLAPAVNCKLNARFVEFLMGFPIGWTEVDDATKEKTRSRTILRVLRKTDGQEKIQHELGRQDSFFVEEVLRPKVHGEGPNEGSTNEIGLFGEGTGTPEVALRTLRDDTKAISPSHRPGLEQQRYIESSDIMHVLSHLTASCQGGDRAAQEREAMQVLRTPLFDAVCLQYMSNEDKEAWRSLLWEERVDILVCAATAAKGNKRRTGRLKALGNSVVPQVARFVGEIILEAEGWMK